MKRPHRRLHLLTWFILTPVTVIAAYYFWTMRPATPYSELPSSIEEIETSPEAP